MSVLIEKYGLEHLTREEITTLITDLQESLEEEEYSASPEVLAMIMARVDRIDAELAQGIDRGIPWEVVRDQSLERLRRKHQ